jgi:hypothetical protein
MTGPGMKHALLLLSAAAVLGGCAYRPTPTETVRIVDSVADIRTCKRLGEVSPTVPTVPGFDAAMEGMLQATVALGGTDLYLQQRSRDWLEVRGIAYRCPSGREVTRNVVRVKG